DTAQELAHDHEIRPVVPRRAKVGVDAELRAEEEDTLLGPDVRRVEFGIADRPLEDRVRLPAGLECLVRKRLPGAADPGGAERRLDQLQVGRELRERARRSGRDLGTDPVAGEDCDLHREILMRRGKTRISFATMPGATRLSYSQGLSNTPLRDETIGAMWDAVVAEHGDREALVSRRQAIRWTYNGLDDEVGRCARGLL